MRVVTSATRLASSAASSASRRRQSGVRGGAPRRTRARGGGRWMSARAGAVDVGATSLDSEDEGGDGARVGGAVGRTYRPGAFGRLPSVAAAEELAASARKKATRTTPTRGLKEAARERNLGVKRLDAMTAGLCTPLKTYVKGFPAPERFHPFERALLELTLSDKKYRATVEAVDVMRKGLLGIGKGYAAQVTKAPGVKEAEEVREKGLDELEAYYRKNARCVDDLKSIAKMLRSLPTAELETPTVALVGAPNVGKSSLVRVLSSGTPEVCNYPFTTKGIKMGHFFIEDERHIVTDTPGLINRAAEERNKIELLTIATLEHLPTCVVFVTDLSGLSGTSIYDQLELRATLYEQFAHRRPWIDVFSKAALVPVLGGKTDPVAQELWTEKDIEEAKQAMEKIPDAMPTSADEDWGIPELKDRLTELLREHKRTLPAAESDFARKSSSKDDKRPEYIPML